MNVAFNKKKKKKAFFSFLPNVENRIEYRIKEMKEDALKI